MMSKVITVFLICSLLMVPCSITLAQGWAIKLAGNASQQVQAKDSPSLSITGKALTMEAWVFPTGGGIIINKENSYECAIVGGQLQFAIQAPTWAWFGNGPVPLNQWSHVAVTYDGTESICWVNGKKMGTDKTNSGNILVTPDPFNLGWRPYGDHQPFSGIIDEARVSSVVRYTKDFKVPTTAFVPDGDTAILLHLDEGKGKTTKDISGNGNDCEIIGEPEWVKSDAPIADLKFLVEKQGKLPTTWAMLKEVMAHKSSDTF
jgi:hypothetical protein